MKNKVDSQILLICALSVSINVILSEMVVLFNIPFLFLDAIGTIFVASNYKMKYGILTGLCTNLLTGLLTSPLAFPYVFVNIITAVLINLLTNHTKQTTYLKVSAIGLVVALLASLVSTPITIFLFGGMTNSVVDILIFSLQSTGKTLFSAAYWGTATRNIIDKVISCILVLYFSNLKQIRPFLIAKS